MNRNEGFCRADFEECDSLYIIHEPCACMTSDSGFECSWEDREDDHKRHTDNGLRCWICEICDTEFTFFSLHKLK